LPVHAAVIAARTLPARPSFQSFRTRIEQESAWLARPGSSGRIHALATFAFFHPNGPLVLTEPAFRV
jgi:hypothetical protein